ncbi:MAG TPA: hypothetical protein VLA49_11110, partial [Anaerolineales bacterium]|nr:hypothetical protein [Anaerolineales bacterium]
RSHFPGFLVDHHLQFVLFFHRQCHLVFHGVTFSLNSLGVSISLNNNKDLSEQLTFFIFML